MPRIARTSLEGIPTLTNTNAPTLATLEVEGRIARLTLNRPDARNALSLDLIEALRAQAAQLKGLQDVSVCVLTGAGRCFCAGMDLKAVLDQPGAPARLLSGIAELTLELRALPQVIVGRINGAAIGGGCGLACVCDISVTHADAKLGYPEVDLGVCPAVVAPWLVRKIGAGRARHVLLQGGTMPGSRAHELGLVTELVPTLDDLDEASERLVERLAAAGPGALAATKGWLNEIDGDTLAKQVRRGAEISTAVIETPQARAALQQAFARRK